MRPKKIVFFRESPACTVCPFNAGYREIEGIWQAYCLNPGAILDCPFHGDCIEHRHNRIGKEASSVYHV